MTIFFFSRKKINNNINNTKKKNFFSYTEILKVHIISEKKKRTLHHTAVRIKQNQFNE